MGGDRPSLEQVLMSVHNQGKGLTAAAATYAAYDECEDDGAAPTSWSFAARQRFQCAHLMRAFRWVDRRMRQELRGLALDHAERLLAAVHRIVTARGEEGATEQGVRREGDNRHARHGQPSQQDCRRGAEPVRWHLRHLEPGGGRPERGKKVWNWRHEARPQCEGGNRWALAIDEEEMGELSTLALETPTLYGIDVGSEIKEWRKSFRKKVRTTGGNRHPRELRVFPR